MLYVELPVSKLFVQQLLPHRLCLLLQFIDNMLLGGKLDVYSRRRGNSHLYHRQGGIRRAPVRTRGKRARARCHRAQKA